jgi:hypothetical protein
VKSTAGGAGVVEGWENFYFLIGSAGAGLIGLLFVVVTLTSGFERSQTSRGANLYMTPTAFHFAVVLTLGAVAIAPGLPSAVIAAVFSITALAGLGIALRSCIGIRTPAAGVDPPHWTDFWLYGAAPAAIYVGIAAVAAAIALGLQLTWAAMAIAGLVLILLLVGIRNAWDLVTFIAPMRKQPPA